jgi:hypothetical protein
MFTDQGGFQMGETTHGHQRTAIPATASLRVDPERLEQLWAMRPAERIEAALQGRFTLGEMLSWASRRPSEPPVVDGEWFFISAYLVDSCETGAGDAQRFWDGDYMPMPADTSPVDLEASSDTSRSVAAAAGDTSGERGR